MVVPVVDEAPTRRVVFNGRFLAQPLTGVQRYGRETLCALDALLSQQPQWLRRTRWQLAVPRDAADVPPLRNFELHRLPLFSGHAWEQLSLRNFSRGAYLINTSHSGPVFKRDQCVTVHDAAVRAHPQTYSAPYRCLHHVLMALLAPRVDTLMTVSRFAAQDIRLRHRLRRDDLLIGRPGAGHAQHATDTRSPADVSAEIALLRRHGLLPRGYLLAVGSLKPSKNFGLIPRALRLLEPALRLPLAVVGASDARLFQSDSTQPQPNAAALDTDAIRWLGSVSDAHLMALYRHAAWFVFPSLYEGFGLPALEAMALGCPVLAARSSSIPEVCGDAALYFDPHDERSLAQLLCEVLSDTSQPPLHVQLNGLAAERLAHYRWEVNAGILLQRLIAVGAVTTWAPRAAPADIVDARLRAEGQHGEAQAAAPMARVLHVTAELHAGVRTYLAIATRELLRVGVQPTIVCGRGADDGASNVAPLDPGVRVIEPASGTAAGWAGPALLALSRTLQDELRTQRYAAVHLHGFRAGLAGRMALARLRSPDRQPPVFYSPHGLSCLHPRRPLSNALFRIFERVAALTAVQLISASPSESRWLAHLTGRKAELLNNPVEPVYFESVRQPSERPLVITIGRVCEQKGPDVLAEIAARFCFAGERVRFVWVGGGDPHFEQILRAADVEVTGWLPPDEVRDWLSRAHVYVHPSRWEGLALGLQQAMAAGVPCVVTDVVGNRDAILHGVTGLVAQDVAGLALRIKALLDAPTRARAMAAAARRQAVQQFNVHRFGRELLSLYRLNAMTPAAP